VETLVAMSIASVIMIGLTAAYSALGRASARLAEARADLGPGRGKTAAIQVVCRAPLSHRPSADPAVRLRVRCDLPERCEYDTVTRECRSTTPL
jgi:hypothetical protein